MFLFKVSCAFRQTKRFETKRFEVIAETFSKGYAWGMGRGRDCVFGVGANISSNNPLYYTLCISNSRVYTSNYDLRHFSFDFFSIQSPRQKPIILN